MKENNCKKCGAAIVGATILLYAGLATLPQYCIDCEKRLGFHIPEGVSYLSARAVESTAASTASTPTLTINISDTVAVSDGEPPTIFLG